MGYIVRNVEAHVEEDRVKGRHRRYLRERPVTRVTALPRNVRIHFDPSLTQKLESLSSLIIIPY